MKIDLTQNYQAGQTVLYSNDKYRGEVVKVTKRSIKVAYNGYTKTFKDVKDGFLELLKIVTP